MLCIKKIKIHELFQDVWWKAVPLFASLRPWDLRHDTGRIILAKHSVIPISQKSNANCCASYLMSQQTHIYFMKIFRKEEKINFRSLQTSYQRRYLHSWPLRIEPHYKTKLEHKGLVPLAFIRVSVAVMFADAWRVMEKRASPASHYTLGMILLRSCASGIFVCVCVCVCAPGDVISAGRYGRHINHMFHSTSVVTSPMNWSCVFCRITYAGRWPSLLIAGLNMHTATQLFRWISVEKLPSVGLRNCHTRTRMCVQEHTHTHSMRFAIKPKIAVP